MFAFQFKRQRNKKIKNLQFTLQIMQGWAGLMWMARNAIQLSHTGVKTQISEPLLFASHCISTKLESRAGAVEGDVISKPK